MEDCLFCKIAVGKIPVEKLYEDDDIVAFWDIEPHAPKHFLVVPKRHIVNPSSMTAGDDELIGRLIRTAGRIAADQGVGDNFRWGYQQRCRGRAEGIPYPYACHGRQTDELAAGLM